MCPLSTRGRGGGAGGAFLPRAQPAARVDLPPHRCHIIIILSLLLFARAAAPLSAARGSARGRTPAAGGTRACRRGVGRRGGVGEGDVQDKVRRRAWRRRARCRQVPQAQDLRGLGGRRQGPCCGGQSSKSISPCPASAWLPLSRPLCRSLTA